MKITYNKKINKELEIGDVIYFSFDNSYSLVVYGSFNNKIAYNLLNLKTNELLFKHNRLTIKELIDYADMYDYEIIPKENIELKIN